MRDMATEKPRFSITIDEETLELVDDYRREQNIKTQSRAVVQLAKLGLQKLGIDIPENENAPVLSTEALRLAKDYEQLDRWGRRQVRCVTDNELERMREDRNFLEDAQPEEEPKIVNLFLNPSAAGPALGETGQACEPYELKPDDPQGAAYAIRVQGDSMEPDFPDGSIAFVNHDEMRDGDIGVFCVDGATVIKQWHYDRVLGMTYLFSLNRKREDCDVLITRSSGRTLVWQGRVITTRRYELPGVSDKT